MNWNLLLLYWPCWYISLCKRIISCSPSCLLFNFFFVLFSFSFFLFFHFSVPLWPPYVTTVCVWYQSLPGIRSTKLLNLTLVDPSASVTAGTAGCHVTDLTSALPANLCCCWLEKNFTQWKIVGNSKCQVSVSVPQSKSKCFFPFFFLLFPHLFNNHKSWNPS